MFFLSMTMRLDRHYVIYSILYLNMKVSVCEEALIPTYYLLFIDGIAWPLARCTAVMWPSGLQRNFPTHPIRT